VLRLPDDPLPAGEDPAAGAGPPVTAGDEGLDALVRGTLAHLLLERLDFAAPTLPTPEAVGAVAADRGIAVTEADVADLRRLVAAFASSPLCGRLAAARRVRREAPFAFAADPGGAGPLLTGFMDVLAEESDGSVLVVDYKSDRLEGADPDAFVEREYAVQRIVYALAALRHGAGAVEVAHCLLERPAAPVSRRFTQDDAPALADALAGLAAGVLEERWEVTDAPHRELCADCPGRRALCSWPEQVTLRPAARA
jgi:hypothetical protein